MEKTRRCNIACFDAEFTARSAKDRGIPEMIQCAFLVYNVQVLENGDIVSISPYPINTYRTFVKPIYMRPLSEYIKELTGIKQEDVDNGKKFKEAVDDIWNLIRLYGIDTIITWGPDRGMMKKNFAYSDYDRKRVKKILDMFDDISFRVSRMYGFEYPTKQSNMCKILNIKQDGNMHDAYDDVMNLAKIIQAICDSTS